MKKQLLTAVGALLCAPGGFAQTPQALPLYPDGAVESNGFSAADVRLTATHLDKCAEADYFVFPADPAQATGQAVVICPGGGYISLAYGHEGLDVAEWMNEHGITAVVLRYRMPNGHPEIPLKDAQTALKLVRQKAADWHVDPNRVGIMGFSAGGHLAATAATHFTGPEDRPDFSILIYPVISMDSITHQGSKDNLLGTNAPAELAERYSNEKQVTDQTPRAFIALSDDDNGVPPANSIGYYSALKKHNVPAELHVYPSGGHGWGIRESFRYKDELRAALGRWLEEIRK